MEHAGTELATTGTPPLRCENVAIRVRRDQLGAFFPMLQRGVTVQAEVACPLRELLCGQFGIPQEYLAGRVTTIFLDNRPVDDLDGSLIHEGSRVTLSAAMPGLVGATMRRSGFYATLRKGITHVEKGGDLRAGQGTVRLKLFNLLLPELAPLVLARGILVKRDELNTLLEDLEASSRMDVASSYLCERDDCGGILLKVSIRE
jgi:hypothetical protein